MRIQMRSPCITGRTVTVSCTIIFNYLDSPSKRGHLLSDELTISPPWYLFYKKNSAKYILNYLFFMNFEERPGTSFTSKRQVQTE